MNPRWSEFALKDVCLRITDGAHHSPKSVEDGLPMASVKDLTPYGINLETCRLISEEDFEKLVRQHCQPKKGDVLIAKDGNSALDTVCELKEDLEVVLLSSVAILTPDPKKLTSSYLRYYLDSETTRRYLKGGFITGAAIPRVILKDFERAKIWLPPLPTQRKIAAILSAYDDLIENNTRRIAVLEEMARRLYREWFVHFRFPGHERVAMVDSELGPVPEGWEVVKLSDIADINASSIRKNTAPERINYVNISSVSTGRIEKIEPMAFKDAPSRARRVVKHGDIIWSSVRPNRKSYCLILDPVPNMIVSTGFAVITARRVFYTYLYHALTTDEFVAYLTNNATGAAYPAVSTDDFENADVVLPPGKPLERFHNIVADLFNEKQNLHRQNDILRRTRDLLLPRLISSEIDVSKLEIDTGR